MAAREALNPSSAAPEPGLPRSSSGSRLNAQAPEFVPRAASSPAPPPAPSPPPPAVAAVPVVHVFTTPPPPFYPPPPPPSPAVGYDMFGFTPDGEVADIEPQLPAPSPALAAAASSGGGARDGLSDDVAQKVTKQVEYYFSDINLATTEHLMRFISKDPEGFVPITVIHGFKKIKSLVQNTSHLAAALSTSSKLVVSEDGKRVKRQQPFTVSDLEELQSRIVLAENLPEDHCYQNLMKVFSAVGSVKTIRTCYPQTANGTTPVTNRSARLDMHFANKLHAFVEYTTAEDAETAIAELNDVRNWRGGLRVRLLNTCLVPGKQGSGLGRKGGVEGDANGEEEDVSTSNQPNDKHIEDLTQSSEQEIMADDGGVSDKDAGGVRGRGRGRGARGRGRSFQYSNSYPSNRSRGSQLVGTPPSSNQINIEHPAGANKQPPGPRMPDGSRGFTMGRGKPLQALI